MRKYIITPVLLAIVCMVMCRCTSNRKASVAANEYLIRGELYQSSRQHCDLPVRGRRKYSQLCLERYAYEWAVLFPRHGFYHTENADYV